ncbi:NUDIX hydrolase [Streptosporangium subroseum]|uniref:NUDIX hydrolase n=1 Tax=Streptosporangium subroseum TaxID=106412 RepID=UPI00308FB99C|nr:NUDIX hydrolase [Streptosporangium subroseum]
MTEPEAHPTDLIRAAGAVVWRGTESSPEVALVHRPRYDDWSFPKGKVKPGEHIIAAALREVTEETGITVELGRSLPSVHYRKGKRLKRVDYWVARMISEDRHLDVDEVDEMVWLPVEEAGRRLSYAPDTGVLRAFASAPPATTPLILVRHALAGARKNWSGDDDERPLDDRGETQAKVLAEVLSGYRPTVAVSSPSKRCVQTLEPYAERAGLEIGLEPSLSESRYDPQISLRLVTEAMASERSTAFCSHGKVLPDLISRITDRAGEARLRKGEFMVLHHADGQIVGVDRYTT